MIAQLFIIAIGIWLMFSPTVFDYVGTGAEMLQRACGPVVAVFGIVALWEATRSMRWWNLPFAAALLIGPLLVEHTTAATLSSVLGGLIIGAASFYRGKANIKENYGGGWMALFRDDPYRVREGSAEEPANPRGY